MAQAPSTEHTADAADPAEAIVHVIPWLIPVAGAILMFCWPSSPWSWPDGYRPGLARAGAWVGLVRQAPPSSIPPGVGPAGFVILGRPPPRHGAVMM